MFWQFPSKAPCGAFKEYRIYARRRSFDPFIQIGTITDINNTDFAHENANIPRNLPWDYYIEIVYDCPPTTFLCYSDTQNVTSFDLLKSIIAFVSINHETNQAYAVWEKNTFQGFWYVDVYNDDRTLANGVTDTFFIDNVSGKNPKLGPLRYVIAAADSCNNRIAIFSSDYHSTINLTGVIDTCEQTVKLKWTKYIGWGEAITDYKLYKRINGGPYFLVKTFDKNTTEYIDQITGNHFAEYYIETKKIDPVKNYVSKSNLEGFNLSRKESNNDLKINYITTDPTVKIDFSFNPLSDVAYITILKSKDNISYEEIKTFDAKPKNNIIYIDEDQIVNKQAYYKLLSKNACKKPLFTSQYSTNLALVEEMGSFGKTLFWNKYFTWNFGVEKYEVYRKTMLENIELSPFSLMKTQTSNYFNEENQEDFYKGEQYCYQIIAYQKNDTNISKSNIICVDGPLKVHFPNAVISGGFKPSGINIDFNKSSMEIYNRWGGLVKKVSNLEIGWDLTDEKNTPAAMDTYIYNANIYGLNGESIRKSGTITIIR